MSDPIHLDERRAGRPAPLRVRDASELQGKLIPKREWVIPGVLVRRSITLFTGDGGVGKSLLVQQLMVATALGKDWLGLPVPQMNSFGVFCEDDDDELDRRFEDICKHYGCSFRDLDGRVRYVSRVGEDNEIVRYVGRGDNVRPQKTPLFGQIQYEISQSEAQLVVLDTAGDVFGGNENARSQVRSFVNLCRGLVFPTKGGIILNAHPSKASMADGSNFSGSTAWHGSVRNRIFLSKPKRRTHEGEEDDSPTDERILRIMKSNYSEGGGKIDCRWQDGVFVETIKRTFVGSTERLENDRTIYKAAEYLVKNGTKLAASTMAKNALVALVLKVPSCKTKGLKHKDAVGAQERLLESGHFTTIELGPPSGRVLYIRPANMRYPGEEAEAAKAAAAAAKKAKVGATDVGIPASADPPKPDGSLL